MRKVFIPKIIIFIVIALAPLLFSCSYKLGLCLHSNIKSETQEPRCEEIGISRELCADCGKVFMTEAIAPLGHDLTIQTISPSCEGIGYDICSCSACDLEYKTNYKSPLGHTLGITETAPTCETEGYKHAQCQACEYAYTYDVTAPLGHTLEATTTYVSAKNQVGSTSYVCACGFCYVGDHKYYSDIFAGAYGSGAGVLAKGIDVSYHNHDLAANGVNRLPLDWVAIRNAGYSFAILRAGYADRADVMFETDYAAAKAAGFDVGAYFYSYATSVEEARAEALVCLDILQGKQFEYPIFFDIEDPTLISLGADTLTQICIEFISTLQENGYYAAIYTNNNWLTNVLHTQKITSLFDIWYARYPSQSSVITDAQWNGEKYGEQLSMWQFSQTGTIDGLSRIDGSPLYFDLNYAYKDFPSLIKALGYNGY